MMHSYRVSVRSLSRGCLVKTMYFRAETVKKCQESMLYTARLKNGRACKGITGRSVYPNGADGDLIWIAMREDSA